MEPAIEDHPAKQQLWHSGLVRIILWESTSQGCAIFLIPCIRFAPQAACLQSGAIVILFNNLQVCLVSVVQQCASAGRPNSFPVPLTDARPERCNCVLLGPWGMRRLGDASPALARLFTSDCSAWHSVNQNEHFEHIHLLPS